MCSSDLVRGGRKLTIVASGSSGVAAPASGENPCTRRSQGSHTTGVPIRSLASGPRSRTPRLAGAIVPHPRDKIRARRPPQLAGRPSHFPSAKHMHVQVADRLAAIPTLVYDQAIPGVLETEVTGDIRGHHEEMPGQRRARLIDFGDTTEVARGDYQDMGRRLRSQIMECDGVVVSMENLRGDFTVRDPAEDAVGHGKASSIATPHNGTLTPILG